MDFFVAWIAPPLLGAVIGYFTNWLAIKMLFRPFREYRLLGIHLPFTPGLLPKERSRIAKSIGETVAAELLTADVVRRRLADSDIREALRRGIEEKLGEIFDGRAAGLLITDESSTAPLGEFLSTAWRSIVSSEAFGESLAVAIGRFLEAAGDIPLARVLPPDKAGEFASLLLSPDNIARLRARLVASLERAYSDGTTECGGTGSTALTVQPAGTLANSAALGGSAQERLIPAEALEPIVAALAEGLYISALPAIETFLAGREVRLTLERYAMEIVRRAVGRLNPLQRLIVSAGQYEKSIAETMPAAVEDMAQAVMAILRGSLMPQQAAKAAADAFGEAASEPFSAVLRRVVSRETARTALEAALDALEAHGPAAAKRASLLVVNGADTTIGAFLDLVGLPSGEIARKAAEAAGRILGGRILGGDDPILGGRILGGRILGDVLSAFLSSLERNLGDRSLAAATGLTDEMRERIAAFLADKALGLLSSEAGRIVAGLDVGRIVVARLEELDVADVERLILKVVDKELVYITVLGGVLGGLIGLVQSLLMFFQ